MNKKVTLVLWALGCLLCTMQVSAQDWYLGVAFGNTSADYGEDTAALEQQVSGLTIPGVSSASLTVDDEDTGVKIYLGNYLNDVLSVEFGYTDLGEASIEAALDVVGVGSAKLTATESISGLFSALVAKLPLTDAVSFTSRVGIYAWDYDAELTETGIFGSSGESFTDDGNDSFYGLGLEMGRFTLFHEVYEIDGDDVELTGIGVNFPF